MTCAWSVVGSISGTEDEFMPVRSTGSSRIERAHPLLSWMYVKGPGAGYNYCPPKLVFSAGV